MDSIKKLAQDLAAAHPVLDDVLLADADTWRRVLEWAADPASRVHHCARKLLLGARAELGLRPANDDLVLRVSMFIDGTHSPGAEREASAAVASSAAVTAIDAGGHPVGPTQASAEVWSPEEFTDRDAISHASTMRAPEQANEVCQ